MVNFADRDVHYLREQTIMLENQNRFLESEFQRQLDKIVLEKNEQINRLIHIIDQTCAPPAEYTDQIRNFQQTTGKQIQFERKNRIWYFPVISSAFRCLFTKIRPTKYRITT